MAYALETRAETIKNQTNVGSKWYENIRKNSWQNKTRIRSQQIREACGIQPINERVERRIK